MLEAKDQGHKCKCFPKKKGLKNFFPSISKKRSRKNVFQPIYKNFNHSKNSAVPRAEDKAIFEDLRIWGQGLENVSSRTPPQ